MKRRPAPSPDPVAAVREFNRFYTREIGVLNERLLASPYSLTEGRLLYELRHRPDSTASELAAIEASIWATRAGFSGDSNPAA